MCGYISSLPFAMDVIPLVKCPCSLFFSICIRPQFISFVREAETTRGKQLKTAAGGILATSNDWQMQADVNRKLAFPQHIANTNLRPDIVLWS